MASSVDHQRAEISTYPFTAPHEEAIGHDEISPGSSPKASPVNILAFCDGMPLDKRRATDAINLDFSKACDTISFSPNCKYVVLMGELSDE